MFYPLQTALLRLFSFSGNVFLIFEALARVERTEKREYNFLPLSFPFASHIRVTMFIVFLSLSF